MNLLKTTIEVTFLSSLLFLISCTQEPEAEESLIRPVSSQEVGFFGGQNFRTFSGVSKTDQVTNLSFRSTGILTNLNISLGQNINKGELLAKLDNVQARLNHENSISSKNSAESEMVTAKLNLDRVRGLFEKGGSALSELEAAKNSYKTAQQNYNSAVRSVDIQKEQVNYGFLYASTDGVISAVNVEVNENIAVGQTVATLNSGTEMEILLGIPESIINFIIVEMPVTVSFTSIDGLEFPAKVKEVSPALNANSGTYPVTIVITNPSGDIKSGMSADVTFDFNDQTGTMNQTLVVPLHAVGKGSQGNFVFKLIPQGENALVVKQQVTIGQLTAEGFEIISGLQAGDQIATAGLQTLIDGQLVKFQ